MFLCTKINKKKGYIRKTNATLKNVLKYCYDLFSFIKSRTLSWSTIASLKAYLSRAVLVEIITLAILRWVPLFFKASSPNFCFFAIVLGVSI